jgi:RNA polymerase sigma factor (sigma-70 family)
MNAPAAALERLERSTPIGHSPSRAVHDRRKRTSRPTTLDQLTVARPPKEHRATQQISTAYDTAFVEAYQTYYSRIFAFVYARLRSGEAAKDLTADIFEKAYRKGHSLRHPEAYASWLFSIARRMVAGYYRQCQREFDRMNHVKESLSLDDQSQDPQSWIIESERVSHLMRHVRTLSRRDQELLSLRFDAELTGGEIARVMGMNVENVRVSIYRALRRLRERLEKEAR